MLLLWNIKMLLGFPHESQRPRFHAFREAMTPCNRSEPTFSLVSSWPNQSHGAANTLTKHKLISIFFCRADQLAALVTIRACVSLSIPVSKNDWIKSACKCPLSKVGNSQQENVTQLWKGNDLGHPWKSHLLDILHVMHVNIILKITYEIPSSARLYFLPLFPGFLIHSCFFHNTRECSCGLSLDNMSKIAEWLNKRLLTVFICLDSAVSFVLLSFLTNFFYFLALYQKNDFV